MTNLTLDDIARLAGVSRSTVSRVVNDQPNVKPEVRQRVLSIIEANNFHPNAAARTLAMQRSATLGLILPQSVSAFFNDPYYPSLLKGIAKACNQYNFTLALFLVSTKEEEENVFSRVGRKGFLDGVMIQSGHHGDQGIIGRMIDGNIPLIVLGRPFRADNVTFIDVDNVQASFTAVSHLLQTGCKRVATITGPFDSAVGIDRLHGYRKAHKHWKQPVDETLIVEGDFTENGGYNAMKKLIPLRPDAVFAASDVMALGAMNAANEANLKIPDEIAFIGFDDLPIQRHAISQLSTVRQDPPLMGFRAVEILIEMIDKDIHQPQRYFMDSELILRDSCRH